MNCEQERVAISETADRSPEKAYQNAAGVSDALPATAITTVRQ
jgi:hypothetical protein